MLDSTSRGSYTFGNSLCIGSSPFRIWQKGQQKIAPFCHSKTGRTFVRGTTCIRECSRTHAVLSHRAPLTEGSRCGLLHVQPKAQGRLWWGVTSAYTDRALSRHLLTAYCFPSSLFNIADSILYRSLDVNIFSPREAAAREAGASRAAGLSIAGVFAPGSAC